jgi:hypothetical protein
MITAKEAFNKASENSSNSPARNDITKSIESRCLVGQYYLIYYTPLYYSVDDSDIEYFKQLGYQTEVLDSRGQRHYRIRLSWGG